MITPNQVSVFKQEKKLKSFNTQRKGRFLSNYFSRQKEWPFAVLLFKTKNKILNFCHLQYTPPSIKPELLKTITQKSHDPTQDFISIT